MAALLVVPLRGATLHAQAPLYPAPQPASPAGNASFAATIDTVSVGEDVAEDDIGGEVIGSGEASYYGRELAGNRTASGERFDPKGLTAAHRSLPFGSRVQVTSMRTGKSVVVRINDRGPFHGGRLIDLSEAAAQEIGLYGHGHGQVRLSLLTE